MKLKNYKLAVKKLNCILNLDREVVGVRFIFTEEEFKECKSEELNSRMTYCRMVKNGTEGRNLKASIDHFGCFAGARALGVVELDDYYMSGHYYGKSGLYEGQSTARKVTEEISKISHKVYGVELRPLEEFNNPPHIAIVFSNTLNAMRMVQGYSYKYGIHSTYKFLGNQSMCAELTADPYETNDINLSLLCKGVRNQGFGVDEVGIGIPLLKFVQMVDGLCETITPVENNPRKREIAQRLNEEGIEDVDIKFNKSYGDGMHQYDFEHFLGQKIASKKIK